MKSVIDRITAGKAAMLLGIDPLQPPLKVVADLKAAGVALLGKPAVELDGRYHVPLFVDADKVRAVLLKRQAVEESK
jgi:hypothetical protein